MAQNNLEKYLTQVNSLFFGTEVDSELIGSFFKEVDDNAPKITFTSYNYLTKEVYPIIASSLVGGAGLFLMIYGATTSWNLLIQSISYLFETFRTFPKTDFVLFFRKIFTYILSIFQIVLPTFILDSIETLYSSLVNGILSKTNIVNPQEQIFIHNFLLFIDLYPSQSSKSLNLFYTTYKKTFLQSESSRLITLVYDEEIQNINDQFVERLLYVFDSSYNNVRLKNLDNYQISNSIIESTDKDLQNKIINVYNNGKRVCLVRRIEKLNVPGLGFSALQLFDKNQYKYKDFVIFTTLRLNKIKTGEVRNIGEMDEISFVKKAFPNSDIALIDTPYFDQKNCEDVDRFFYLIEQCNKSIVQNTTQIEELSKKIKRDENQIFTSFYDYSIEEVLSKGKNHPKTQYFPKTSEGYKAFRKKVDEYHIYIAELDIKFKMEDIEVFKKALESYVYETRNTTNDKVEAFNCFIVANMRFKKKLMALQIKETTEVAVRDVVQNAESVFSSSVVTIKDFFVQNFPTTLVDNIDLISRFLGFLVTAFVVSYLISILYGKISGSKVSIDAQIVVTNLIISKIFGTLMVFSKNVLKKNKNLDYRKLFDSIKLLLNQIPNVEIKLEILNLIKNYENLNIRDTQFVDFLTQFRSKVEYYITTINQQNINEQVQLQLKQLETIFFDLDNYIIFLIDILKGVKVLKKMPKYSVDYVKLALNQTIKKSTK